MKISKRTIYIISIISFLFVVGLILLLYFFVIKKPKGSCTPNQCNNHGTCKDGICTCTSPYTGSDCSDTTSGCNPPCKNNKGTCNSKTTKCNCIFGTCGEDCSLNCGIHSTGCVDNKCVCKPTYTGPICDKKCIDVCTKTKNPKYTGNCIDGGVCECKFPFYGPTCSDTINMCKTQKIQINWFSSITGQPTIPMSVNDGIYDFNIVSAKSGGNCVLNVTSPIKVIPLQYTCNIINYKVNFSKLPLLLNNIQFLIDFAETSRTDNTITCTGSHKLFNFITCVLTFS
jgi:hypothetical protein